MKKTELAVPRQRRRAVFSAFVVLAVILCAALLTACSYAETTAEQAGFRGSQQAGDSALPDLDGEYAYVLARVLSKDAEENSIEIEVVPWNDDRPFSKGKLVAGDTGSVSCSELVFFPAGIGDGSTVVVCCLSADADAFPLTACTIEKLELLNRLDAASPWADNPFKEKKRFHSFLRSLPISCRLPHLPLRSRCWAKA